MAVTESSTLAQANLIDCSWRGLEHDLQLRCAQLWESVWPSTAAGDTAARLHKMNARCADLTDDLVHIASDHDGHIVAVARTFEHTIGYGDTERNIVALASVCSDPLRRGEGFGDAVVRAAFDRVQRSQLPALFQTPVPHFYERFGSRLIDNHIVTSKPGAKPFADPWAMIQPGPGRWDDDVVIDLRIAGW